MSQSFCSCQNAPQCMHRVIKSLMSVTRLGNHDVSVARFSSRAASVVSHALLLTNLCYVLVS